MPTPRETPAGEPSGFALELSPEERRLLDPGRSGAATSMAMRIVCRAADLLGAPALVEISSSHIDGCLYHGDSGVVFAERLVQDGARVCVPTTLNVGGLDLLNREHVRADPHRGEMALRLMRAYQSMGCAPTWTCAPYQAGHRPGLGDQIAWGESNAVVFANSVLGARTNRYGDFLDICCAITGRAPAVGLHLDASRYATVLVDLDRVSGQLLGAETFYPVFGSWLGRFAGDRVPAIVGLPADTSEDRLKALGAAAASTGAVALFHAVGLTPEAPDLETALGGVPPAVHHHLEAAELRDAFATLSTVEAGSVDAVALGSPHFSVAEFKTLLALLAARPVKLPFYVCTSRQVLAQVDQRGWGTVLRSAGLTLIADTCVVVAPILPPSGGVLMTNSGKFAHYTPGTTGYDVLYGSLEDCVETAVCGELRRDLATWA